MNTSKTVETIEKFYSLCDLDRDPTDDEKYFMCYIELEMAKAIVYEFNKTTAQKIAKIILDMVK